MNPPTHDHRTRRQDKIRREALARRRYRATGRNRGPVSRETPDIEKR